MASEVSKLQEIYLTSCPLVDLGGSSEAIAERGGLDGLTVRLGGMSVNRDPTVRSILAIEGGGCRTHWQDESCIWRTTWSKSGMGL